MKEEAHKPAQNLYHPKIPEKATAFEILEKLICQKIHKLFYQKKYDYVSS